jgi:AcrR family transcriptional regulator
MPSTAVGAVPRETILKRAMELASVEGLEGLTIGRVATDLKMSKSALFARFGSKEELQRETVEAALAVLHREVIEPAQTRRPGLDRLQGLVEGYLGYLQRRTFPGGCLLAAASLEFDSRPGIVRDTILSAARVWSDAIEHEVVRARDAREIRRDSDPAQIMFEINAFLNEANATFQLQGDRRSFERARTAIAHALA